MLWYLMPHMTEMKPTNPLVELGALKRSQVWFTVAIGIVGSGGMFAIYTYISWIMTDRAGLNPEWMWLVLMVYGLGAVGGNWFEDGWDRCPPLGSSLFIDDRVAAHQFYFASSHAVLGIINFGVAGFFGTSLGPILQIRLMEVAEDAQTLAAALNHAALNLANAAGAFIGGSVIATGFSYSAPALAGVAMALAAICIWVPMFLLRRRKISV